MVVSCGGEKCRLRFLGDAPGVVSLGAFTGNAFVVNPGWRVSANTGKFWRIVASLAGLLTVSLTVAIPPGVAP
jgi:hypothetical protein